MFKVLVILQSILFIIQVNRIGNTWMGDPVRLVLLAQIVKVIKEQNLLTNVVKTGTVLLNGLEDLQVCLACMQN